MQLIFSVVVAICVVFILATTRSDALSLLNAIKGSPHNEPVFDDQNKPKPKEIEPSRTTGDFRNEALVLHNNYRTKHHAPPLVLDNLLNTYAQNWAQTMAKSNSMRHSNGKYGENIYMSSDTKMSDSDAVKQATSMWYNEISKYNYNSGFSPSTGHFTQIVWKDSKRLGFGVARSSKGVYVCASYDTPGNVMNQFPQNVLRP